MNKKAMQIAIGCAVIAYGITSAIWESSGVSHHITRSLNGKVISDYWTTNRYEQRVTGKTIPAADGYYRTVLITNTVKLW